MKRLVSMALILVAILGCVDNSRATALTYEISISESSVENTFIEGEKWVRHITYPIFSEKIDSSVPSVGISIADKINKDVDSLIQSYSCEAAGDEQGEIVVTYMDRDFVSIKYELSWMCLGMSHLDSKQGGRTYAVEDASSVTLSQLVPADKLSVFTQFAVEALNEALAINHENGACKADAWSYFYVTEKDVILGYIGVVADTSKTCQAEITIDNESMRRFGIQIPIKKSESTE